MGNEGDGIPRRYTATTARVVNPRAPEDRQWFAP